MVGLEGERAKVLGRLGWCPSSNQERVLYPARRSPFIGLGLYGAPVFIMLVSLAAPLSLSYLPWRGLRFAPSRCPKPSPLCGCVCVHQHKIPDDMSIPSSASLAYGGGAMQLVS
jgi:hypothetical protein